MVRTIAKISKVWVKLWVFPLTAVLWLGGCWQFLPGCHQWLPQVSRALWPRHSTLSLQLHDNQPTIHHHRKPRKPAKALKHLKQKSHKLKTNRPSSYKTCSKYIYWFWNILKEKAYFVSRWVVVSNKNHLRSSFNQQSDKFFICHLFKIEWRGEANAQ